MTSSSPYDPPDRPGLRRMRRRRRRSLLLLAMLVAAAGGAVGITRLSEPPRPARVPLAAEPTLMPDADIEPSVAPTGYPTAGPGTFAVAGGRSPVRGHAGPLRRYRVEVEQGAGPGADAFAATVDTVLGDPRSWIASGELRVQRVPEAAAADFTVYLATPVTSERMCAEGGLRTARYTSCRLPGRVVLNLARWMTAVPDYGAPLDVYRTYMINHEVGHEFGELHEACPRPGAPAPVMQQQTYGLDGCVPNAWPYVDGVRYSGEPTDGI